MNAVRLEIFRQRVRLEHSLQKKPCKSPTLPEFTKPQPKQIYETPLHALTSPSSAVENTSAGALCSLRFGGGIIMRRFAAALSAIFVFGIALAGVSSPFKGWGSGSVIGVNPQPTYTELTVAGTGQATQLGRFSRLEVIQINGTGGIVGTIDFTAANGDVLSVSV